MKLIKDRLIFVLLLTAPIFSADRPVDEFLYPLLQKKSSNNCQQVFSIQDISKKIGSYLNPDEIKEQFRKALGVDITFYSKEKYNYAKLKELLGVGLLYQQLNQYQQNLMTDLSREHSDRLTWFDCAIQEADIQIIEFFMHYGADLYATNVHCKNILAQACFFGKEEMVRFLIKSNIDVNRRVSSYAFSKNINSCGMTPLYCAMFYGRSINIARLLIDHKADINVLICGTALIIKLAVDDGLSFSDIYDRPNVFYRNILWHDNLSIEFMQLLFDRNVQISPRTANVLMFYASRSSNSNYLKVLLKYVDPDYVSVSYYSDETPLQNAIKCSRIENIKLLLQYGVDPKTKNCKEKSAFDYISESSFFLKNLIVKLLEDAERENSTKISFLDDLRYNPSCLIS